MSSFDGAQDDEVVGCGRGVTTAYESFAVAYAQQENPRKQVRYARVTRLPVIIAGAFGPRLCRLRRVGLGVSRWLRLRGRLGLVLRVAI